jgi:3-hydroxy acid dehydrogenase/malonic semialdehyde reductase
MPLSTENLRGKTVLITGASSGIGRSCAVEFAQCGSNLILVARRVELLEKLKGELNASHPGASVSVHHLDVTDKAELAAFKAELDKNGVSVDVLVNNAGLALGLTSSWEVTDSDIDTMFNVNVKGLLAMQAAFVPGMVARGTGHIINISSISGTDTYAGGAVYCATKHAVHALTHALRQELVGTPVRVSMVSPGLVETEFSIVRFKGDSDRAKKVYENIVALEPSDVAEAIVFAASRHPRVQMGDILVLPSCQARHSTVFRGPVPEKK